MDEEEISLYEPPSGDENQSEKDISFSQELQDVAEGINNNEDQLASQHSPIKMPENVQSSTPKGVKPKDGDATSDDGLDYDEEFKPLKSLPDVHVEVTEGKLSENSKTKGRKI